MMIAFVPNKTVIPLVFCFVQQEEIIRKQFHQYKKTCRCRETKPVPTYIESTTSAFEHQTKIDIDGSTAKTVIHKQL